MDFFESRDYYGISYLPDFLSQYYSPECASGPVMDREWLNGILDKYEVSAGARKPLMETIDEIEADAGFCAFTNFIVEQTSLQRNRLDPGHINIEKCSFLSEGHEQYYGMIILLACVLPSMRALEARGVPEKYYIDRPAHMLGGLMRSLERGNIRLGFAWAANFYSCSIFTFGRFHFILHPYDSNFTVFKNVKTGDVIALAKPGAAIRRTDGQYNGVSGYTTDDTFVTVYEEKDGIITANPVSPVGAILEGTVSIDTSEWKQHLHEGDAMLALHIPGGPGYTPESLRESAMQAIEFYKKYFPEYDIRGIWSESWLYDPHLRLVLAPEKRIIKMQDQMYSAAFPHGHASIHGELHTGNENKSSLVLACEKYEKNGGTFASCFMFILTEDVPYIGTRDYLYGNAQEREDFVKRNK